MRKKLNEYLPSILLKTYEFPLLCDTEQREFDHLNAAVDEVLDAQFVSTAGERGIERYEQIFSIVPQDTDTLDERRFVYWRKSTLSCRFLSVVYVSSLQRCVARTVTGWRLTAAGTC